MSIVSRKDASKQLYYTKFDLSRALEDNLYIDKGLKANVTLKILMKKKKIEDGEVYFIFSEPYFRCKTFTIYNKYDIMNALDKAAEEINNKIAEWLSEGSGWVIEDIQHHYVDIVKHIPLRGSSYLPLPEELRNSKKGLINLKNSDNKCLIWNLVRQRNPRKKYPQKITGSDYEFIKGLVLSGIDFPVTINQIPLIEKRNKININVFGYHRKSIYPIYISKEKYSDHMENLYIDDGDKNHYVLIKDFNRLMYNFTKHKERKHFCMHCLQCRYSKEALAKHIEDCIAINGDKAIDLPQPFIDKNGVERIPSVYFKNHHKQLPCPFVIYADFESNLEKINSCEPSDERSYTEKYQKHTAVSFGYKVVCHFDKKYSKDFVIYRGEDPIGKFLKCMNKEVKNCQKVIKNHFKKTLKMSEGDERNFKKATRCHICKKIYIYIRIAMYL